MLATTFGQKVSPFTINENFTPTTVEPGSPGHSYALSGFEDVSPLTGRLSFHLPLLKVGGRGEAGYTITLPIDAPWSLLTTGVYGVGATPIGSTFSPSFAGWGLVPLAYTPGKLQGRVAHVKSTRFCNNGGVGSYLAAVGTFTLSRLTFTDADGSEHELRDVASGGLEFSSVDNCAAVQPPNNRGKTFTAYDGSGMVFVATNDVIETPPAPLAADSLVNISIPETFFAAGSLYFRDGRAYVFDANGRVVLIRDRNGNKTTINYSAVTGGTGLSSLTITDSNNRTIQVTPVLQADAQGNYFRVRDEITYPGFNQALRTITIYYAKLKDAMRTDAPNPTQMSLCGLSSVPTPRVWLVNDLFPGSANMGATTCHNPDVVSSILLPNATSYTLRYNEYAELTQVGVPTGGRFEYDIVSGIGGSSSGVMSANGQIGGASSPPYTLYRRVTERRVYRDSTSLEGKTLFSVPPISSGNTTVTVTKQNSAGTPLEAATHAYNGSATSASFMTDWQLYPPWQEGKETATTLLAAGTSSALRTITNIWQQRGPGITSVDSVPSAKADNPRITRTDTQLEDGKIGRVTMSYDQFNNVVDTQDYDYGTGTGVGTVLLRKVHRDYKTSATYTASPTGGNGVYLPSLVFQESVALGGTTNSSLTTYDYDVYTGTNNCAITARTGAQMDAAFGVTQTVRGNLTGVQHWLNTGPADISLYQCFDRAGNVTKKTDGRLIATTVLYDANSSDVEQYPFAHPTKISRSGFTVSMGWDVASDKMTSVKDPNSKTTTYGYSDTLERLKTVSLPDGGSMSYDYVDTSYPNSVETTTPITAAGDPNCTPNVSKIVKATFDGLGRPLQTTQTDPQGNVFVDSIYDGLGRTYKVSNPYRTPAAPNYTTTLYDSLGRLSSTTAPDNASTGYQYAGNQTTITNPRGLAKVMTMDALGRLTKVTEENSTDAIYGYDPLGNLVSVMHGVTGTTCSTTPRARCFVYDSLSRLRSANNPESGTITYDYDANSNLSSKVASGRGVTLALGYDLLDRVTSKTYTGGANGSTAPAHVVASVGYAYDTATNGQTRLGSVTATTKGGQLYSTSIGSYDAVGRVTGSSQTIAGTTKPYSFSYVYNVGGGLELLTYPGLTKQVKTCYDSAGRIGNVANGTTAIDYATVDSTTGYAAHGGIKKLTLGNGVVESTVFDSPDGTTENNTRLQPTHVKAVKGASTLLSLSYSYCAGGTVTTGCATNNGNVWGQTLARPAAGFPITTQTFNYDSVDRLTTAAEAGGTGWSQTNGYDVWGNHYVSTVTGLPALTAQIPQASTWFNVSNQVTSWSYDGDGNLTNSGGVATMIYDGENRMVMSTSTTGSVSSYVYDGMGRRVQAVTASGTTNFVYDAMGQLAAEYAPVVGATPGIVYLTSDTLGSTRMLTDGSGVEVGKYDYLPFGEEIWGTANGRGALAGYGAIGVKQKFTGKERDGETGLDFFGARYMSSAQGRFSSPDPLNLGARIRYPQTWNMYSYALNNPLRYVDPTGMWSTEIHSRIIDLAFSGLSDSARNVLKRVSEHQDRLFMGQSRSLSYQHKMRAPWETPQEAQTRSQKFSKERLEAAQILNSGSKDPNLEALEVFGELLHAEVDGTAPGHVGFQVWEWTCPFAWMGCAGNSIIQHKGLEATISPQQTAQAVAVAQQWYLYTFGEANYRKATKEPVGCVETSDSATRTTSKECK